MYFLSIESSTKIFSVALSRGGKVLRFRNLKGSQVLEDTIVPVIDRLLDAAKVSFNQLGAFAVGLGPGSFTSLRIGLSTVKAFAMATGKPIVGIGSLNTIAEGASGLKCDEICVVCDARRNSVYSALFQKTANGLRRKGSYQLSDLPAVLDRVHGRTLFVGDAVGLYRSQIQSMYKESQRRRKTGCRPIFAPQKFWFPESKQLAKLAYSRLSRKDFDDPVKLLPAYLYASDCQVSSKA